MTNSSNPFSRIRLVYRRSSPLLKCVVLGCIVLALVALLVIRAQILQAQEIKEAERAEAAQLEQENAQLEENIAQKGTREGIMQFAQDHLGLLPPGSEIIVPED